MVKWPPSKPGIEAVFVPHGLMIFPRLVVRGLLPQVVKGIDLVDRLCPDQMLYEGELRAVPAEGSLEDRDLLRGPSLKYVVGS